jgi:hypothetical protein
MKKLLLILILIFSFNSFSKADDVSDFEIEGMSIGDSLLDYFNNVKIKEFINHKSSYNYLNSNYVIIGITNFNQNLISLSTYSDLGVTIDKNDAGYEIFSIAGQNYTHGSFEECTKNQGLIAKDIKKNLLNDKFDESIWKNDKWISGGVSVGRSKMHDFYFKDNSAFRIICYELNENNKHLASWQIKLDVIINSKKFNKFLEN